MSIVPARDSRTTSVIGTSHRVYRPKWAYSLPFLVSVTGLVAFGVALLLSCLRWPLASIHDEFSYLLLADTLRHGRLSNPTPDAWPAFQSFHTILIPTYSSKYPLGPGILLAIGWSFFGTPTAGLWLGAALCAMASTWMLAGVLPRRWALLGGLLVSLHPTMQFDWSRSYMNGWLTATAATIVVGAILRLRRKQNLSASVALGLGIGLLALCRPFEGLIFTAICVGGLAWQWCVRQRTLTNLYQRVKPVVLGSVPCMALALYLVTAHNHATTGKWWRMPYQVHEQQYAVAPLFITQSRQIPELDADRSRQMPDDFHKLNAWSCEMYDKYRGARGYLMGIEHRVMMVREFWGFVLAIVPCVALLLCFNQSLVRWCALGIGLMIVTTSFTHWIAPHYLAPLVPWLVLLATIGIRKVTRLTKLRPGILVLPLFISSAITLGLLMANSHAVESNEWAKQRRDIELELIQSGGKHLILVRYPEQHNVHQEWVYNLAELEESTVVWARGCRESWRQQLVAKYGGIRTIWELNFCSSDSPPQLVRVPVEPRL